MANESFKPSDASAGPQATSRGGIEMGPDPTRGDRFRRKASESLDQAADALRKAGRRAEEKGGVAGRAGPAARRLAEGMDDAADYVRATRPDEMRGDLERTVRRYPVRSMLIAAAFGYVFGRILR